MPKKKPTHGGKRTPGPGKKLGRPPSPDKFVRVVVLMPAAERDVLKAHAGNVSEFVRGLIAKEIRS